MIKNFVLDTNVLLHNPAALASFTDNNVIIPIVVVEELDKFKASADKKGMHARQALREIDSLIKKGALDKGAKMENGGTLKISFSSGENLPDCDASLNDNKILVVALELQKKGEKVIFVSKDVNARIKAAAFGLKTSDFEKQKVQYDTLYKGWRELLLPSSEIAKLYKDKKLKVKEKLLKNEYLLLKAEDKQNESALAKYVSEEDCIVPLPNYYDAMGIKPLNMEQRFAFDLLLDDKVKLVTLIGTAGTGKTLIAVACALQKTIGTDPKYEKTLVSRPVVPLGKDIGYLPGTKDQKLNYWMQPIFDNLHFILNTEKNKERKDGKEFNPQSKIDYLLDTNVLEIEALTYIRGRSIPHQFMIIDEAQNLTPHEIKTIISRAGEETKIILTGDAEQIDNPYLDANSNGLSYTAERMKEQDITGHVLLTKSERSELASLAVNLL